MSNCKICNSDCSWLFCDDCSRIIGQGTAELQKRLESVVAERDAMREALGRYERMMEASASGDNSLCDEAEAEYFEGREETESNCRRFNDWRAGYVSGYEHGFAALT